MTEQLVGVIVTRRAIAVAVFDAQHLAFTELRQLSVVYSKAEESTVALMNWILETFRVEMFALSSETSGARADKLLQRIIVVLKQKGIPFMQVADSEVIRAFDIIGGNLRKELRRMSSSIWPQIGSRPVDKFLLDAAALGLYVQVERLLRQPDAQ